MPTSSFGRFRLSGVAAGAPDPCVARCARSPHAPRGRARRASGSCFQALGVLVRERVPYDALVPNIALPRPRSNRRPGAAAPVVPIEPATPEIIESAGLRWIHIESPRAADRDWLETNFDFHQLDYEDVYSRNNRPKLDQYDDYVFIVLHFPMFEKSTSRMLTAELDLFMGPDYLITLPNIPLPPLNAMFERYREKDDLREATLSKGSGYLLYKIVDTCVDAIPLLFPGWAGRAGLASLRCLRNKNIPI